MKGHDVIAIMGGHQIAVQYASLISPHHRVYPIQVDKSPSRRVLDCGERTASQTAGNGSRPAHWYGSRRGAPIYNPPPATAGGYRPATRRPDRCHDIRGTDKSAAHSQSRVHRKSCEIPAGPPVVHPPRHGGSAIAPSPAFHGSAPDSRRESRQIRHGYESCKNRHPCVPVHRARNPDPDR